MVYPPGLLTLGMPIVHSSSLLRSPLLWLQGTGQGCTLGRCRHSHVQTPLLDTEVTSLQDTELGASRKGSSKLQGLSRRHPHPLATSLTFITDTVFSAPIRIARALTHAGVSCA